MQIVDGLGRVAAHVGDHIRLSRATLTYQQAQDRGLVKGLSEDCAEPYFLVGDEVTYFDPRIEATELRLSDPDVLFLSPNPPMDTDGRREDSGRGVRELQARWSGLEFG